MAPPLLSLQGIELGYGGNPLFTGVDAMVRPGDRICLVGRNGSGKSTLLKVAAGLVEPDAGEVVLRPGHRVAYLPQEPDLSEHGRVDAYVAAGLPHDGEHDHHLVDRLLEKLDLDPAADPAALSGGEARRAALARVLVCDPDILLLDEPTNHLDLPTIRWLEEELAAFRGAFVVISHDRAFLTRLTRVTLWLDRGLVRRLDRGFEHFEAWSEEIQEREATERHKLDRLIEEETRWSRQGITARRKRNQGRLRRLYELRAERARQIAVVGQARLEAEATAPPGRLVVEAEEIAKSYGERRIIAPFSTRILRGDRVGIIGPNGAGKTTLLRMLTGDLKPDAGRVRLGTNLETVYLDQRRAVLAPGLTPWDFLCDAGGDQVDVRGRPRHVVGYLRDFLFEERQARTPVGSLSGGERNRLVLAKALARRSNFLILDEPTNDLDMDTLDLLQETLADYDGTLLLVSHDRDFLDRVVTSVIALEGDDRAVEHAGGYSDYAARRQPASEAAAPAAPARKAAAAAPAPRPARAATKLGYKQQRALETLPGEISDLEDEIARLKAVLADGGLYSRDPDAFNAAAGRLAAAEAEREAKEESWLELELLREELASS
ncbi:MAG: ATP-binding cassette domain-containing protein [Hyphomicrobiales bacterium]|nr:ATP-binding cassette domain-containing protein [Hyphomicrobiales bacterium]